MESRATAVVRFGAPIAVRALRRMTKQMPPFRHVPTCRRAARMIAISSRKIRRERCSSGGLTAIETGHLDPHRHLRVRWLPLDSSPGESAFMAATFCRPSRAGHRRSAHGCPRSVPWRAPDISRHDLAIGGLPMDIGMEVRECHTQRAVQATRAIAIRNAVGLECMSSGETPLHALYRRRDICRGKWLLSKRCSVPDSVPRMLRPDMTGCPIRNAREVHGRCPLARRARG